MLTAAGRQVDFSRFEELYVAASIPKPFRAAQLIETITNMWSMHQAGKVDKATITQFREDYSKQRKRRLKSPKRVFDVAVLLVEDSPTNQAVATRVLKKFGCTVDLVENGKEAVQAVLKKNYDLIFMDCQMPVMDGFEATRQIRKNEGNRHTPIAAMTAVSMQGGREKCLSVGMDDYITKPIRQFVIEETLVKYCKAVEQGPVMTNDYPTPTPQAPPFKVSGETKELQVLDPEQILKMIGRDKQVIKEFTGIFLSDISEQIQKLEEAVHSGNMADAEKLAHRIKGASGDVGGIRLYQSALEVEKAARDNSFEICNDKVPIALKEFSALRDALKKSDWSPE
jgi:CheY-like chemotaxis protein